MSLTEVKSAIMIMSEEERAEISALLHELEDDDWDRQMKQDALPGGRLHRLAQEGHEAYLRGESKPFPGRAE